VESTKTQIWVENPAMEDLNLIEKIITPVAHFTKPQKEQLSKANYQMHSDLTNKNRSAVAYSSAPQSPARKGVQSGQRAFVGMCSIVTISC